MNFFNKLRSGFRSVMAKAVELASDLAAKVVSAISSQRDDKNVDLRKFNTALGKIQHHVQQQINHNKDERIRRQYKILQRRAQNRRESYEVRRAKQLNKQLPRVPKRPIPTVSIVKDGKLRTSQLRGNHNKAIHRTTANAAHNSLTARAAEHLSLVEQQSEAIYQESHSNMDESTQRIDNSIMTMEEQFMPVDAMLSRASAYVNDAEVEQLIAQETASLFDGIQVPDTPPAKHTSSR